MRRPRRREGGAAAVEFALIAPVLFIALMGILEFGVAFLQVQSILTGVRQKTVDASSGSIPGDQTGNVSVSRQCSPQQIGEDVVVAYDTSQLPGGGIMVRIPFIPTIEMRPVLSATFRCEA